MELRSSRSRSKTPFSFGEGIGSQEISVEHQTILEESSVKHTYSTRSRNVKSSSGSDEVFVSPEKQISSSSASTNRLIKKNNSGSKSSRHKTSDYSSEEGENEITSSKNVENESSINRSINNSHGKSKNGNANLVALKVYKEAGEYWNKFPKTDYTYSKHSKDRFEVAPGVVGMPNMSRRSLHRYGQNTYDINYSSQTIEQDYVDDDYYLETAAKSQSHYDNTYEKNYNNKIQHHSAKLEPKRLFDDELNYSFSRNVTRIVNRFFMRIYISVMSIFTAVSNTVSPILIGVGKNYYKFVSRMLLFDTWLLLKNTDHRRLMGTLLAIFMLPLLLLFGWWLLSSISSTIFPVLGSTEATNLQENVPIIVPPIIFTDSNSNTDSNPNSDIQNKPNLNINEIIQKLLENPSFENLIIKHINSKSAINDQNQNNLNQIKLDLNDVRTQVNFLAANNLRLGEQIRKCCKRQYIYLESYVSKILADLIGKQGQMINSEDISKWLGAIFVAKSELENRLSNLTSTQNVKFETLIENSAKKVMDEVLNQIKTKIESQNNGIQTPVVISELTDAQISKIVKNALAIYDADKTGMVDYALESSGGQILSTRCTESYYAKTAQLSIWGIPLWYPRNTPRTAINPDMTPGNCWAFQGFPGFLVIQLSSPIKISAFSLEHIPKSLAPGGRRDSAPKSFNVVGLRTEDDPEPVLLGKYEYNHDGDALQYFPIQNESELTFRIVELKIDSNHGHLTYTCLYRFRVHGVLAVNEDGNT